jgi:uncharacterized membrane protein
LKNDGKIIVVIQLLMLLALGLGLIGFELSIFRQIIGFIYLTFVPGYLLLKFFKSRGLDWLEIVLYSVGLSIAFLMFVGLSINALYPFIGIAKPISPFSLTITVSILVVVLWALSYKRGTTVLSAGEIISNGTVSSSRTVLLPALFLIFIPLLSVLGTFVAAIYGNEILLILAVVFISIVPVLVVAGKFIPNRLIPLAVIAIAIALLLQYTLISKNLTGYDVNTEYYYSSLVLQKSYWNPTLAGNINAMASIVMLSPIYSNILNLDNIWVFKIVYPLLFSLVPLGLYFIYQKFVAKKLAFLSVFFFMSFSTFFTEMTSLNRQEIAEFFFVLLILLALDKAMKPTIRTLLSIVFAGALIISHYGLSYIIMFTYLGLAFILLLIIEKLPLDNLLGRLFGGKKNKTPDNYSKTKPRIVTGTFILSFFVIALSWYTLVSGSSLIGTITNIGKNLWNGIFTQFFDLGTRGTFVQLELGGPTATASIFREMQRILQYITEFFIIAGVLGMILTRKRTVTREFFVWTITSMILLILSIALPYLANSLNATRIYQITLLFLALPCVLGGLAFLERFLKVFRKSEVIKTATALILVMLVFYFFFNTGLVYKITGDTPTSFSLDLQRLKESTGNVRVLFDDFYIYDEEVASAQWLSAYRNNTSQVFGDTPAVSRILLSYGMTPLGELSVLLNGTEIPGGAYIYLRRLNEVDGLFSVTLQNYGPTYTFNVSEVSSVLEKSNVVYQNGESSVLMVPP